jgi:drug/metabolite transporter (DMT)-like permease
MAAGLLLVSIGAPLLSSDVVFVLPELRDAIFLTLLAGGCTLLPFALSLSSLRHISAFSATIALNMEPVYAIILAIVLLGEQRELSPSFYVGVAIVLAAVFLHPLLIRRPPAGEQTLSVAAAAGPHDPDRTG